MIGIAVQSKKGSAVDEVAESYKALMVTPDIVIYVPRNCSVLYGAYSVQGTY